ncbi:biotin synthase BioB [Buchnera aphidicola]|uniref:Biotin synthase n=1 Tax=Buchnera aphidicola subsp. Melaphis rhois TaxID=118103 RepID=A0A4D6Y1D0_BUCMH|nr:biotin synthase BioB [Buchnera aphidicola]QCI23296.1 biotin synthase BioB [Buchnera aphidicola (Melaphis rhois)]
MKKKWDFEQVKLLFDSPLFDVLFLAQTIHRKYFNPNEIQISTLLSIKTGLCPEDCKYCSQSSRYKTNIKKEKLLEIETILKSAKRAKELGSERFCMGAAWKNPKDRDMPYLEKIIKEVKNMGMETCMTLGTLSRYQAERLAQAGLDFYNHNLDTSESFYKEIVTTRSYQDRLNTLNIIRNTGMKVCSGGIIGLGEQTSDRIKFLIQLSNLSQAPESIPINTLVKVKGTPMENNKDVDMFDVIRIIAITRIMMPKSYIRLSAGRKNMNEQTQAMCFMVGANSIFYGCKLLTTANPERENDLSLFKKLGLHSKNHCINAHNHRNINDIFKNKNIIENQQYYNAGK